MTSEQGKGLADWMAACETIQGQPEPTTDGAPALVLAVLIACYFVIRTLY